MASQTKEQKIPAPDACLPGRIQPLPLPSPHAVLGAPVDLEGDGVSVAAFGLGCFWGAERLFWRIEGVRSTAVGYAAGTTPNPTYEEVCSGRTGHAEVVRVAFDAAVVSFESLLMAFWENHDPTQGMAQGNDEGTQYRSCVLTTTGEQRAAAERSRDAFAQRLVDGGLGPITTTIDELGPFYFAEEYHQQYLHKNPGGYCGLRGTGVRCV